MKKCFCFLVSVFWFPFSPAQERNTFPLPIPLTDELPFQINISDSGEIFISGRVSTFVSEDCYISKHDSAGNFHWSKIIGGPNYDYFQKTIFYSGKIICTGNTNSFGNQQNFFVSAFNQNGDSVFTKILGGKNHEKLMEIIPDESNFLLGGYSNSFGSVNNNDILLIETDSLANPLWAKNFAAVGEDVLHVIKKAGNDFFISGNTNSFGAGMKDVFAMKTDSAGNLKWLKCFGASDDEDALDAIIVNKNIYLSGYTKSVSGWQDLWILKLDTTGNLLWNKVVDFGLNEKGNKIFFRNGKIFVCGYLQTISGTYDDIFILSIDENGENISAKNFPVAGFEYGNFIGEINEKILVAGFKSDSVKMKIFEISDSIFSCNSTSHNFDSSTMQVSITDTFFTVNSIPTDSIFQTNGGDFSDFGNDFVKTEICFLPPNSSDFRVPILEKKFRIFPNPNSGKFMVQITNQYRFTKDANDYKLQITNLLGKIVFQSQYSILNTQYSFDFPNGIYFLQISGENFLQTEKIIMQHY